MNLNFSQSYLQPSWFPLTTSVIDEKQQEYSVGMIFGELMGCFTLLLSRERTALGEIQLEVREDHIYIIDMKKNDQIFKHVGSALHEFAIRQSFKMNLEGRVKLDTAWKADGFHFINGFRFERKYDPVHRFLSDKNFHQLVDLISDYQRHPFSFLEEEIRKQPLYKKLKERATKKLGREPINLQEEINRGFFININQKLQHSFFNLKGERIKTGKRFNFGGAMFLSDETRLKWRVKLE